MFFSSSHNSTFIDFILAAQGLKPGDTIIDNEGRLEKNLGYNQEDKNKITRELFRNAVEKVFSKKQIQHLCARYNIDLMQTTAPLSVRHIECFGVGAANPYTFNLKEQLPWYSSSLEKQSLGTIYTLFKQATARKFIGNVNPAATPTVHGGVEELHENIGNDRFLMDKRRAQLIQHGIDTLYSEDPNIPYLHPFYSRLCMAIISLLETNEKYPDIELVIPTPIKTKRGGLDFYKVYKIISRNGLTAVALVPVSNQSNLPPLLCFRGTKHTIAQTDGIPSVLNDMEESIGKSGFLAAKEQLTELMKDVEFTKGKKITVLSYSLGGAHAGYFMRDFWRQVLDCISFNCVGNDEETLNALAKQINALEKEEIPPAFWIHRNVSNREGTKGDWTNKSGEKHLGWGITHPNGLVQVVEWIIDKIKISSPVKENIYNPQEVINWLDVHSIRPMDGKRKLRFPYKYNLYQGPTNCNRILDTYTRDRSLEDLRRKIGHEVLYTFVSWVYSVLDFMFRLFGIEFFKKNL